MMTHLRRFPRQTKRPRTAGLGAAILLTLLVGCGSNAPSAATTTTPLPTCPAQVPSYSQVVASIIKTSCSPCHYPGGTEVSVHDFSTYARVEAQSGSMLNAVYSGLMPPAGSPALSASDSNTLLTWLVCNAPNN